MKFGFSCFILFYYMTTSQFVQLMALYLPVYFGIVVNTAAVNIHAHVFLFVKCARVSLGGVPRRGLTGLKGTALFCFTRSFQIAHCRGSQSHDQCTQIVQFSTALLILGAARLHFCQSDRCEMAFPWLLVCSSLMRLSIIS